MDYYIDPLDIFELSKMSTYSKTLLKVITSLLCLSTNINFIYSQFQPDFKINQFFYPFTFIDENSKTYIAVSSASDSVEIIHNIFYPLSKNVPNLGRELESYTAIYDEKKQLIDSFHFHGTQGVEVRGAFVDSSNSFYFALRGQDTIYCNSEMYINPYIGISNPFFIFRYNGSTRKLNLCKVIGHGFENICIYADEKSIYIGAQYGNTAYVDTLTFKSLINGSAHELDILLLKLNKEDYSIEYAQALQGYQANYPLHITADNEQNIFLAADIYSPFLVYKKDTIWFTNSNSGNGLFMKFTKNGDLDWYHTTRGFFSESIITPDRSSYVLGNYYNSLNIDSQIVSSLPNTEQGFVAIFNPDGNYNGIIKYDGVGDRKLNLIKKSLDGGLIIAGDFKGKIYESVFTSKQCVGGKDSYIYFIDTDGKVNHSFYFQGDSTEQIEDVAILENGNFLILGYTFSDTLICGYDTLFTQEHKKNYFIYEISSSILNHSKEFSNSSFKLKIFPTPFRDYVNLEVNESSINHPVSCVISNYKGQIVNSFHINHSFNRISTSGWVQGFYLFNFIDARGKLGFQKILKM